MLALVSLFLYGITPAIIRFLLKILISTRAEPVYLLTISTRAGEKALREIVSILEVVPLNHLYTDSNTLSFTLFFSLMKEQRSIRPASFANSVSQFRGVGKRGVVRRKLGQLMPTFASLQKHNIDKYVHPVV